MLFVHADVVAHPKTVGRVLRALPDPETVAICGSCIDTRADRGFGSA